jgi:hypothetical protein
VNICPVCYAPLHAEGACPSCGNFITFPRRQPTGREVIVGGVDMAMAVAMMVGGGMMAFMGLFALSSNVVLGLFFIVFFGWIFTAGVSEYRRLMNNLH